MFHQAIGIRMLETLLYRPLALSPPRFPIPSLFARPGDVCYTAGGGRRMVKTGKKRLRLLIGMMGGLLLPGLFRVAPILAGPAQSRGAEAERLVLAFYYAWYDQKTWDSGQVPDRPLTPYDSDDPRTITRQIEQAQSAGIDALVLNWWGQGNRTEKNLKALLEIAAQKGFRVAVDFDLNSPFMSGVGSYEENLRHLLKVHAAQPAYLRYQGRPVVFFFNVARLPVATWQSLRDRVDPGRDALWIAEGTDLKYQAVFDGHHLYSITWPNGIPPGQTLPQWGDRVRNYNRTHGTDKLWVATVMPGYDDRKVRPRGGFARPREKGDYYRLCWQAAIASGPQWVVINSFNEWPEGSYIEPSQAFGTLYLDLTREWAARFKGADFTVRAAQPAPASHTPRPPMPVPPTPTAIPPQPASAAPLSPSSGPPQGLRCDRLAGSGPAIYPF